MERKIKTFQKVKEKCSSARSALPRLLARPSRPWPLARCVDRDCHLLSVMHRGELPERGGVGPQAWVSPVMSPHTSASPSPLLSLPPLSQIRVRAAATEVAHQNGTGATNMMDFEELSDIIR